ncbi:MAG: AEC family transporter [Tissierella sp.]|uniref:AEC family transporter n=1 Tax=Tissierella sp. TaxID=41274 RepID=UPI003F98C0BC
MEKAIIETVISLFIIIFIGFFAGKRGIIDENLNKGLTKVLINVALPFMIVSSFIFKYEENIKSNVIKTFAYSFIAYMVVAFISYILLLPIKKDKKTILHFANIFVNTGYIGFPILNSIYGPEGVIYGSIFNMFFVIFMWTYGIALFKGDFKREELKKEIKSIILNSSILAVFIGIIIMVFDIKINSLILNSIKSIGSITRPLSMIIIGVILSKVKFKKFLNNFIIYYGILIKLIIIPVFIYLISLPLTTPSKALNSVIIMTAMPASAMTSILAESFDKEKEFAAVVVSLTTLLSLLTTPLIINIIK